MIVKVRPPAMHRVAHAIRAAAALIGVLADAGPVGAEERRVALELAGGVVRGDDAAGRAPTVAAAQGDSVELVWTSDRAEILHLHGYDIETRVAPGGAASMAFVARAAGRFPVEIHDPEGRHRTVIYVEIHPR